MEESKEGAWRPIPGTVVNEGKDKIERYRAVEGKGGWII